MIYIMKYKTWKINVTTNPAMNINKAGERDTQSSEQCALQYKLMLLQLAEERLKYLKKSEQSGKIYVMRLLLLCVN